MHPILNTDLCRKHVVEGVSKIGATVSVDFSDSEDRIWAKTRKGHQSTINRCRRHGITVAEESLSENHTTFLKIYNDTLSRVDAEGCYCINHDDLSALGDTGEHFRLFVAHLDGAAVSACIVSECNGIVQAVLGGTLGEFMHESPFSFLLHEIRIWAKRRGNRFLHLGGGVGASTEDGLFHFKAGFSRTRHEYFALRMISNVAMYKKLCSQQSEFLKASLNSVRNSKFFPGYRASREYIAEVQQDSIRRIDPRLKVKI